MAVFSMKSLFVTPSINAAGRKLILSITIRGIKYRHAECYILFIFILIVVMLSVITMNAERRGAICRGHRGLKFWQNDVRFDTNTKNRFEDVEVHTQSSPMLCL